MNDVGVIEIEGIRYSIEFFKNFGGSLPLDSMFQIVARENGTITIKRLDWLKIERIEDSQ